jgi:hypothetical protein
MDRRYEPPRLTKYIRGHKVNNCTREHMDGFLYVKYKLTLAAAELR